MSKWAKANPEKARKYAREYARKWRAENPEAVRRNNRAHHARNPWSSRRHSWLRQGIDAAAAEARLRAHNGRCDVCGTDKAGGQGGWQVDHDHDTGEIRGVLCRLCNLALGRLDSVGLYAFERYLRPERFTDDGPVEIES